MAARKASKLIIVRPSSQRGHADHGWLNTYHTFSFAMYDDPRFDGFGSLRVMNEDRVRGGQGFGRHAHRDYEIFSYVVKGALKHEDSLGNTEIIKRGQVQFTSAGSGIFHSEFNASKQKPVHFLQIWVQPNKRGLAPSYQTKEFPDEAKRNRLCPIVVPEAASDAKATAGDDSEQSSITIHQDLTMFASILSGGAEVAHDFTGRMGYLHVVDNGGLGVEVNGVALSPGDGAFFNPGLERVTIVGLGAEDEQTELVMFDLAKGTRHT